MDQRQATWGIPLMVSIVALGGSLLGVTMNVQNARQAASDARITQIETGSRARDLGIESRLTRIEAKLDDLAARITHR